MWERERRDRLKSCFAALAKLLPCYDPSSPLSKIEILQRAAALIGELQRKNKELLSGGDKVAEVERGELRRLHERVDKLLARNEQLSRLLQAAGIKAPSECGTVTDFRPKKKWSDKISPEVARGLALKLDKSAPRVAQQPTANKAQVQKKKLKQKVGGAPKKKPVSPPNENVDLNNKQPKQLRAKCKVIVFLVLHCRCDFLTAF